MPALAILGLYEIWRIQNEERLDDLAQERAAGEGMVERHVQLKGIEIPRMLSWAELRALRHDLAEAHI